MNVNGMRCVHGTQYTHKTQLLDVHGCKDTECEGGCKVLSLIRGTNRNLEKSEHTCEDVQASADT